MKSTTPSKYIINNIITLAFTGFLLKSQTPPVLAGIEGTPITYTEGQGEVFITSAITVNDVDDLMLESASVQISAGYVSTEDVLRFNNQSGITGTWTAGTGTMNL